MHSKKFTLSALHLKISYILWTNLIWRLLYITRQVMPYLLSRGNIANAWNEISAVLMKNVFLFGFSDFSFGHLLKQTKEKTRGRTNDDQESINEPTR